MLLVFEQRPLLYVRDPKALHYILIKEEPIYQESQEFIAYACPLPPLPILEYQPAHRNNMVYFGPGLLSTLGTSCCLRSTARACYLMTFSQVTHTRSSAR